MGSEDNEFKVSQMGKLDTKMCDESDKEYGDNQMGETGVRESSFHDSNCSSEMKDNWLDLEGDGSGETNSDKGEETMLALDTLLKMPLDTFIESRICFEESRSSRMLVTGTSCDTICRAGDFAN